MCTLSGGQLQGWEWSHCPDYWDNQYPWRGYIPQLDSPVSLGPHAWVFISDSASNQVVKDPSSTPVYLLESVQKNACNLRSSHQPLQYGSVAIRTSSFQTSPPTTDWINWPYAITWILLDRRWESCREILDILGFVLYALALDPSWRLKAWPPAFFAEIDRWQLSSSHWHSIIVDPASVQPASIIDFICNCVPVALSLVE